MSSGAKLTAVVTLAWLRRVHAKTWSMNVGIPPPPGPRGGSLILCSTIVGSIWLGHISTFTWTWRPSYSAASPFVTRFVGEVRYFCAQVCKLKRRKIDLLRVEQIFCGLLLNTRTPRILFVIGVGQRLNGVIAVPDASFECFPIHEELECLKVWQEFGCMARSSISALWTDVHCLLQ